MGKNCNKVFDCFAGGSVRGIVAGFLGKDYTGIDLRKEQIDANYSNYDEIKNKGVELKPVNWICGDSANLIDLVGNSERFDLLFSCPPYFDLEVYSDDERDLSAFKSYEEFLSVYNDIIRKSCSLLKENSFACFVVGEVRDNKGIYRNFVGDTITAFRNAGLAYYNEMILVNCIGTLPIRIDRQFNSGRKIGKRHQNVLIFYKGDVSKIKDKFGKVIDE